MHWGVAAESGGKGAVKDKDTESGGDGAPGETVAELGVCVGIACRSLMKPVDSGQWLACSRSTGPFKGTLTFLGIVLANRSRGRKRQEGGGGGLTTTRVPLSASPPPPQLLACSSRAESEGGDADRAQEPWNFSEK